MSIFIYKQLFGLFCFVLLVTLVFVGVDLPIGPDLLFTFDVYLVGFAWISRLYFRVLLQFTTFICLWG